jgi:TetR/AcrR family transcriptional repressor of nem operon
MWVIERLTGWIHFSAELSSEHDDIRLTISEIFGDWAVPFETVIAEGQKVGELSTILPPARAARFIVNSLQGALLRCKVDPVSPPPDDFDEIIFWVLLGPGKATNSKEASSARRGGATGRNG